MDFLIVAACFAAATGFFGARWVVDELAFFARIRGAREASGLASGVFGEGKTVRILKGQGERKRIRLEVERNVPQMLDAVALGMRAGLSFERSLGLYAFRFDDELACACRRVCREWESGLVDRDEALRSLAEEYDVASLSRFVANALRALRFGSPMVRILEVLAGEARSCYRARMEELVAKAPVKMLAPTAALILPAMLILMMGPVALELIG